MTRKCAIMRQTELKPSPDGYYRRNLGYTKNGAGRVSQPKFNLGSVKRTALERLEKVAAIWRRVELDAAEDEVAPRWNPTDFAIAKAVAAGEAEYRVERTCDDPYRYSQHVDAFARLYPEIRILPADEEFYCEGKANAQVLRKDIQVLEQETLRRARFLKEVALETPGNEVKYVDLIGDATLHQALDAYSEWIGREKFDNSEGAVNDTGVTRQNLVRQLKAYLSPNRPLSSLSDFDSVDKLFGLFRNRPITIRHGKPMARKTASNLIGELARFFDWLHRTKEWEWRKPEDYLDIRHKPIDLEADVDAESKEVPTYTVEQLHTLFVYATPLEKLLFVLGINCAFGADQIGRLKIGEIQERSNGVHYIGRIRRKQKVRGTHRLFKITTEGLEWAIRGREEQSDALVLLNRQGHSLYRKTKSGRRCRDIANAWYRLLDRVCEAKEKDGGFPRYGFNTLRDTSSNMIRKISSAGDRFCAFDA